jgi:hypothetical protein
MWIQHTYTAGRAAAGGVYGPWVSLLLFGMTRMSSVWQVSAPIIRGDLLLPTCNT